MSLDDLQAQLRGALDQQFSALKQQYEAGISEARAQAMAEAQRHAEERIAQLRADMEAHIIATVDATRAEAERVTREAAAVERQASEQRIRKELDRDFQQQLEHVINSVKRSAELERESEKRRAVATLDAERERASAELAAERERAAAEVAAERERVAAELAAERERAAAELGSERERLQAEMALAVEAVRTELAGDHERAVTEAAAQAAAQARTEAEQARTQLYAQARTEGYEQARQEAAEQARAEIEAVSAEADAAKAEIEAARAELESELRRVSAEYREEREQLRAEIEAGRQRADSAPSATSPALPKLIAALRELDDARTLTQALDAFVTHAAGIGRAALFVIDGDRLKSWKAAGIAEVDVRSVESSIGGRDLLARAIQAGQAMRTSGDLPAPPFARAPAERAGIGLPVMIGGRAVAVLYADHGDQATDAQVAADFALLESLARHTSAVVALRTAMRTLDVLRGVPLDAVADDDSNDEQGAKRFARLLVSEIKLYNEAAVRAGRQQRDILQRLGPEIDRARRLYEERVPASLGARHAFFQQELVQTLADGDPALLG